MIRIASFALGVVGLAAACVPAVEAEEPAPTSDAETGVEEVAEVAAPTNAPAMLPPGTIAVNGELEQGGWIRGTVPTGTETLLFDGEPISVGMDGAFFAAFDRDADGDAVLAAERSDGSIIEKRLAIAPRDWQIERVNVARRSGGSSEAFMKRRMPELEAIYLARQERTGSEGWRQDFIWPATGRISGRFGSQRIYRGEPGSYHSGLDIARPTGTPFVAPADGTVVLVNDSPYSLEGNLVIIDHGMGLNSAFIHLSDVAVEQGQQVSQGALLGRIGATGRATGPHLHWSITWNGSRLDPLLFLGPMPD